MIIKCPECGHQVSDKAPVCPSCGVEIAGHVTKCPHCGEIYLTDDEVCPNCHQPAAAPHEERPQEEVAPAAEPEQDWQAKEVAEDLPPVMPLEEEESPAIATPVDEQGEESTVETAAAQPQGYAEPSDDEPKPKDDKEKKNKHISLLVSLVITVITCFVLLYFYKDVKANNENNEFVSAMQSKNADVLQQYITDYQKSAPIAHLEEATKLLNSLRGKADDWPTVAKQNTREAYTAYLKAHPDTPHKQFIEEKMDSIDWAAAKAANTEDAYAYYIDQHRNGKHHVEAGKLAQQLMTATEKKEAADAAKCAEPVRRLLIAMNSKSTDGIESAVAEKLNFNGKSGATAKDVAQYMRDKLYQADVKSITWKMEKPTACDKVESEDDKNASYQLTIPAKLEIDREGGKPTLAYTIKATVNGQGRITAINLARN